MFTPRPIGTTSRRVRDAVHDPHPANERFDEQFPVAMKCLDCGKHAYGPRGLMAEAMREHRESHCPARHTKADEPIRAQLLFPKQ